MIWRRCCESWTGPDSLSPVIDSAPNRSLTAPQRKTPQHKAGAFESASLHLINYSRGEIRLKMNWNRFTKVMYRFSAPKVVATDIARLSPPSW